MKKEITLNKVFPVGLESMLKQIENVWFDEFPSEKFSKGIQCECLIKMPSWKGIFSNICKQGLEISAFEVQNHRTVKR